MARTASAIFLAGPTMAVMMALPGGARAQVAMMTQPPCLISAEEPYCLSFQAGQPIPTIRAFTFAIPKAGSLLVSFNGSMNCASSGQSVDKVFDLIGSIVTSSSLTPSIAGAGSLRHAGVLKDTSSNTLPTSATINLATERVIVSASGGTKTVYYKLLSQRMDPGTLCYVYNATFSVVFVPKP